jgi:predicted ATPase
MEKSGSIGITAALRHAGPTAEAVYAQMARLLASEQLAKSPVLRRFLEFVVVHALEGTSDRLKEYTIGVEVFDRGPTFDPTTDTIVRAHARRLRTRLAEYYDGPGRVDPVVIAIPKGSYAAVACLREADRNGAADESLHLPMAWPGSWLPAPRTPLLGRDADLDAVKRLVMSDEVRLLTLVGAGGSGKTSLALKAVHDLESAFGGRVIYIPLAAVNEADAALREIGHRLGLRQTEGKPLEAALEDHLRHWLPEPCLILLDNFEHLLPLSAVLSLMLDAHADLRIMVTSRSVLRLLGERVFEVQPLPTPSLRDPLALGDLAACPSVALFVQRAAAANPRFRLTPGNAAAVAEICVRLDGLPLAIELAAARVGVLTPNQMRERLSSPLALLTSGPSDLPPRQRTLRDTVAWSHSLLSSGERRLFRRLSIFAGGWTLEAAEAVCNTARDLDVTVLDGVSSLLDKHLILATADGSQDRRFNMLETVREYAREQLTAEGEAAVTTRAHAAYSLVLAEEGGRCRTPVDLADWLARCDDERENHRAAVAALIEANDGDWATRLAVALYRFWEHRGLLVEGRAAFERILQLPESLVGSRLRARALGYAGSFAEHQGDHDVAAIRHRRALELYRQIGDQQGVVAQLNSLAASQYFGGNLDEALRWSQQTYDACKELGDASAITAALTNLGTALSRLGRHEEAREHLERALAMFASQNDATGMAWVNNHLGDAARAAGDRAEARHCYEKSTAIFHATGDQWGLARSACDRAHLACDELDFDTARTLFAQSVQMFDELGHLRGVASAVDGLARLALAETDSSRALTLGGVAAALRHATGAVTRSERTREVERTHAQASCGYDPERARELWRAGARMSLKDGIEYALSVNHPS